MAGRAELRIPSLLNAVWKSAVVDDECLEAEFNASEFVVELTSAD